MGKLYTIRDACKILQLNPNTLRKWDREGKIKCIRLSDNFRRVPESEINRILGVQNNRKSLIYAAVSSHDQKADLDRQIQKLQTVSPESHVVSDIRSGMKFNRKGFIELLELVEKDKVSTIYVTHKDRLASLAITHRGIDLCGDPFPVSASASWQSMKDEYLYIRDKPEILKQVRLRLPTLRTGQVHNIAQCFENGMNL